MSTRFIKKFTEEKRVKIVEEALECGSNSLIAAKYDLHPGLISIKSVPDPTRLYNVFVGDDKLNLKTNKNPRKIIS